MVDNKKEQERDVEKAREDLGKLKGGATLSNQFFVMWKKREKKCFVRKLIK